MVVKVLGHISRLHMLASREHEEDSLCELSGICRVPSTRMEKSHLHQFWRRVQGVCSGLGACQLELQESLGQVGPGDYLTLSQQLIGSYDPRALLGYELWLGTNGTDQTLEGPGVYSNYYGLTSSSRQYVEGYLPLGTPQICGAIATPRAVSEVSGRW